MTPLCREGENILEKHLFDDVKLYELYGCVYRLN